MLSNTFPRKTLLKINFSEDLKKIQSTKNVPEFKLAIEKILEEKSRIAQNVDIATIACTIIKEIFRGEDTVGWRQFSDRNPRLVSNLIQLISTNLPNPRELAGEIAIARRTSTPKDLSDIDFLKVLTDRYDDSLEKINDFGSYDIAEFLSGEDPERYKTFNTAMLNNDGVVLRNGYEIEGFSASEHRNILVLPNISLINLVNDFLDDKQESCSTEIFPDFLAKAREVYNEQSEKDNKLVCLLMEIGYDRNILSREDIPQEKLAEALIAKNKIMTLLYANELGHVLSETWRRLGSTYIDASNNIYSAEELTELSEIFDTLENFDFSKLDELVFFNEITNGDESPLDFFNNYAVLLKRFFDFNKDEALISQFALFETLDHLRSLDDFTENPRESFYLCEKLLDSFTNSLLSQDDSFSIISRSRIDFENKKYLIFTSSHSSARPRFDIYSRPNVFFEPQCSFNRGVVGAAPLVYGFSPADREDLDRAVKTSGVEDGKLNAEFIKNIQDNLELEYCNFLGAYSEDEMETLVYFLKNVVPNNILNFALAFYVEDGKGEVVRMLSDTEYGYPELNVDSLILDIQRKLKEHRVSGYISKKYPTKIERIFHEIVSEGDNGSISHFDDLVLNYCLSLKLIQDKDLDDYESNDAETITPEELSRQKSFMFFTDFFGG